MQISNFSKKINIVSKNTLWLISFIDLIMLLICFFIMIYSALAKNQTNHTEVLNSINNKFSFQRSYNLNSSKSGMIYQVLTKAVKDNNLNENLKVIKNNNIVSLLIPQLYLEKIQADSQEERTFFGFLNMVLFNFSSNKIELLLLLNNDKLKATMLIGDADKLLEAKLHKAINFYSSIIKASLSNNLAMSIKVNTSNISNPTSDSQNQKNNIIMQFNIYDENNNK